MTFLKNLVISSLVISSALFFSGSLPVLAKNELKINKKNQSEISRTLDNIKQKDPQKAISQKLAKNKLNENELISEQTDNLQIKFNLKDKKIKIENKEKGNLTIGIPNPEQMDSVDLVDENVVYSSKNTDVIMEAVDGGVRQIINIKDNSAPNFYDFPVELEVGEKLEITENGGVMITGDNPKPINLTSEDLQNLTKEIDKKTADFIKSNKTVKVTIGKPWAIDSNKKELKTWYTIENNNILRQHIDLTNAVFPVVVDPISCGNAISNVSWINRNGVWSASNNPTECGKWNCSGQWGCWYESYQKTSSYGHQGYNVVYIWDKNKNYSSMYNQFMCHADIARGWKPIWNLEPSKADKGYWGFANFWDQCN